MKTKIVILLAAIVVVTAGAGFWLVGRNSSNNDQPPSSGKQATERETIAIALNVPADSLLLAQEHQSLQVAIRSGNLVDIARVEYLLDGKLATYSTQPPFTVDVDISGLSFGEHTLQAVAYAIDGRVSRSEVFTFTLSEDKPVEASNAASQTLVKRSISKVSVSQSSSSSASGSSGGGDSGNGGGGGGPVDTTPWPDAPPAEICGNTSLLSGPSSAPAGAVVVPAGDNSSGVDFTAANTTFWFAPGVHTIGVDQFSQIAPRDNTTFVGAPGAILDGQHINRYAFTGTHTNVKIQYLTIINFESPRDEGVINHDSGTGWTMEYLTAQDNGGGAIFAGTNNTVRYSCMKDNGQYGFQVYSNAVGGPSNVLLDHNEIVGNNADDWESQVSGCGCTGGGKFWDAHGVTITNNYVHKNLSVGLRADTNDTDFLVEGNYILENG